ncbi:hypothetical protein KSS87_018977, partial [Heliosperma pusillum]
FFTIGHCSPLFSLVISPLNTSTAISIIRACYSQLAEDCVLCLIEPIISRLLKIVIHAVYVTP